MVIADQGFVRDDSDNAARETATNPDNSGEFQMVQMEPKRYT